jgi:hypothetical protein
LSRGIPIPGIVGDKDAESGVDSICPTKSFETLKILQKVVLRIVLGGLRRIREASNLYRFVFELDSILAVVSFEKDIKVFALIAEFVLQSGLNPKLLIDFKSDF